MCSNKCGKNKPLNGEKKINNKPNVFEEFVFGIYGITCNPEHRRKEDNINHQNIVYNTSDNNNHLLSPL